MAANPSITKSEAILRRNPHPACETPSPCSPVERRACRCRRAHRWRPAWRHAAVEPHAPGSPANNFSHALRRRREPRPKDLWPSNAENAERVVPPRVRPAFPLRPPLATGQQVGTRCSRSAVGPVIPSQLPRRRRRGPGRRYFPDRASQCRRSPWTLPRPKLRRATPGSECARGTAQRRQRRAEFGSANDGDDQPGAPRPEFVRPRPCPAAAAAGAALFQEQPHRAPSGQIWVVGPAVA